MGAIMHGFLFVPAVVFGIVTAVCWAVCAVIDRREARMAVADLARPVRRGFRPVVIQGGLAGGAISSLRVPQTSLGLGRAARSYGALSRGASWGSR